MKRVLILNVDDHDINRYLRTQVLSGAGFSLIEAATGAAALELAVRERPDLVLLDVHLPDANGVELCRTLKTDPRTQRTMVLQISASAVEMEDAVRGLEGGADGYLVEPVEPQLLVAHVRSLLRLRSSEIALKNSEQRLGLALNAAKMGTWDWDMNRDVVTLGGAHQHLFGDRSVDFGGNLGGFLSLIHPEDRDTFESEVRSPTDRTTASVAEFRILGPDRNIRWMSFSGQIVPDETGGHTRFMGVMRDVTDRKQAQLALEQANTDLKHFVFAASHDLQEPLRTVRVFSELLRAKLDLNGNSKADQHLARVEGAANRMQALVTSLLSYSQVGKAPETQRAPVPLDEALDQALRSLEGSLQETGGKVSFEPLPIVFAWGDEITQVFQNLISNAIAYRRPDTPPRIHVKASRNAHHWTVSVTDNGQGFEPHFAEQIFEAFTRLQGAEVSGTGLGLAICRRIVERHGGRMWAESLPGEGSTFHFELPADESASPLVGASTAN